MRCPSHGRSSNIPSSGFLGNSGDTLLDECSMVPSTTATGSFSSLDVATTSGASNISQDSAPLTTEQLDDLRVEIIRNQLVRKHLNAQAVEDLLAQRLADNATNKLYRKNQLRFLEWATRHNVFYTAFTHAELVNFLAEMRQEHGLQASTLKTLRTAVAHLNDDPSSISESQLINSYLDTMMKQALPLNIHRPTIDVSPALAFTHSISSLPTTSIKRLQQKLDSLLTMAAFLRSSDLTRSPFDSCSISDTGCLKLKVVAPKETRGKRRIIKSFTIHPV
ncbi:hypothetical protein [Parasitella parasitica]|uniref:Uncharacterized protein n=1 Tax=Parasitella parasitica TaxID=35722 RepID=A0A0B7N5J8_9FUNG|nr:hypothetical protein [Parasitella parasitica]